MCYLAAALKNFPKKTAAICLRILASHNISDVLSTPTSPSNYFDLFLVVVYIDPEEFAEVCDTKNLEIYLVSWTDVSVRVYV